MTIETISLSCPVFKSKFLEHKNIKEKILSSIERAEFSSVSYSSSIISKSDWNAGKDCYREYMQYLFPALGYHMEEVYSFYGFKRINIHNCWFQQYQKGSGHMWHIHMDCQWTNVYYVEMPDEAPFLQLKDPITKQVKEINVEEGDIISFPSFIIHRSPEMKNDVRKTIISFNSCGDID
jgi:hypothetical protein